MSTIDYEQLYRLLSDRREIELRQMQAFRQVFDALLRDCTETDRQLALYVETLLTPPKPVSVPASTVDLEKKIDGFLFQMDRRLYLKRATAARIALRILLLEEPQIHSMNLLYKKITQCTGGTAASVERNLRSFRGAVAESSTAFYQENLAAYNSTNAEFYWNALRLLKQAIATDSVPQVAQALRRF